jgi:hypothetical protein
MTRPYLGHSHKLCPAVPVFGMEQPAPIRIYVGHLP